jgi:ElaB/YqjD/DUF883 family membrane-anchored ribosome-binding protein
MMVLQLDSGVFLGRGRDTRVDLPQAAVALSTAVDPNQVALLRLTYNLTGKEGGTDAMFKSGELGDELLALKSEMSRLLSMPADDMLDAARDRSEALVEQVKATLSELGETLSEEEEHVEKLIAERPIAALVSAFALGVAIGFLLRRN